MALELLMGLEVVNRESYGRYRAAMTPILERFGGSFGYDFSVSEVLISRTAAPINRVFTIRFPDGDAKAAFFSNPEYVEIRAKFFEGAVGHTTMLASYEVDV